jgi:hypothetical protein
MTDQELKDLVASLAIESAKNEAKWDKLNKERAIESAKTEKMFQENSAKCDKLNEERAIESAKTEKMIKELSIQMSGMSKTQGEITEDYLASFISTQKEMTLSLYKKNRQYPPIPSKALKKNIYC